MVSSIKYRTCAICVDLAKAFDSVCKTGRWLSINSLAVYADGDPFMREPARTDHGQCWHVGPISITNDVEHICFLVPILNIFLCKDTQASNWFSEWIDGVFISYRLDYRVICQLRLQSNNMTQNWRMENLLLEDDAAHVAHSLSFAAHHMLLFRTLRSSVVSKSISKALSVFSSLSTNGKPITHVTIANVDLRSTQQFTYLGWVIAWMQNRQRNWQLSLRGI